MIRYALLCELDHEFESWFDNSAAYDKLRHSSLIDCPHCNSKKIRKALMTPQLGGSRSNKQNDGAAPQARSNNKDLQKRQSEAVDLARKIRHHIEENADNVGDKFAQEARKIHFEEVEPHNIYGNATPQEVTDLKEEGVEFAPLPELPEDKN